MTFLKRFGVAAFGAFVIGFGYILVVDTTLPGWAIFALILGGIYGAIGSITTILGPFGAVRQRILNLVLLCIPFLVLLVHSYGALYAFLLGTSLVVFVVLLQDLVTNLEDPDNY